MDEYLDDETEWVKQVLDGICKGWRARGDAEPKFLTAANPDQVKRNVLAGFKDALLLPVTIVPRTVNFAIVSGTQAVNGLAMLNPQKWTGARVVAPVNLSEIEKGVIETGEVNEKGELNADAVDDGKVEKGGFEHLQLLVSLDTALELIQADRDSLKRAETFARYPGRYGRKVRDTIEEIFILMLKATADKHIAPGFQR